MLLALALLGLLAGAVYFSMGSLREQAAFEEGVSRFESLLRMARADACGNGVRLRLAPKETEDGPRISILAELKPLAEPEQFAPYAACTWSDFVPERLVRITRAQLVGPDAYRTAALASPGEKTAKTSALAAVTFYPDGSCDSAVFELAPLDETDSRRAVILLDGLNGTITTHLLDAEKLEEHYAELGLESESG